MSPLDRHLSIVAVQCPEDLLVKFFRAKSLMFGQTAAVYGFLRFSRALSALAGEIFKLVTVEFFDDFSQIDPVRSSPSAQFAMEGLLKLLGWKVAMTESKRKPFAPIFVALGVQLDFTDILKGDIHLCQKPGRLEALELQIASILDTDCMSFKDALSVRGRVYFSEGQVFGRIAAPVIHMLTRYGSHTSTLQT